MLIAISLLLTIILNALFTFSTLKLLSTIVDFSIFSNSPEGIIVIVVLFGILPTIGFYLLLRKFSFKRKLKDLKSVKIIFSILLFLFIAYVVLMLWSATIRGGGITFAIGVLFRTYVLPIMVLLFIVAMFLLIKKFIQSPNTQSDKSALTCREIKVTKYISIASIVILLLSVFNPYSTPVRNFKINSEFTEVCKSAKTTIHKEVQVDSLFLYTTGQSRYCKIDKFNSYYSHGGGMLHYPRFILDANISIEVLNDDEKTKDEFKYSRLDEKNFRDGVPSKTMKSKYGYRETNIYKNNLIYGSLLRVFNIDTNETIAESKYYTSIKTDKICGDFITQEEYSGNCLKANTFLLNVINAK